MKICKAVILTGVVVLFTACSKGYDVEGGDVVFKTWDEAHGQRSKKLDADIEYFQILGSDNLHFAKGMRKVFFRGIEISYMDPINFSVLNDYFGTDGYRITAGCKQIEDVDANEFRVLKPEFLKEISKSRYATDGKKIFWFETNGFCESAGIVTDYDISFKALNNIYSIDINNVYYGDLILKDANPNSFKILNKTYTTDGINVYSEGKVIIGADAASFKALSDFEAKDKNHTYHFSRMVD